MSSDNNPDRKNRIQSIGELVPASMNRRDVLKASVATGAVGLLTGRVGGAGTVPHRRTTAEQCPTVEGVENGFVWVQKTTTIWASSLESREDAEDLSISGDGSQGGFTGRGNLGQGKVKFHEPGTFEFRYKVDSNGLTWVEEPETLISVLFPTEPWDENGTVTGEDIVRWSIYPYERDYPLSMSFEIDEPGTYRIAYGPASGTFLVKEWLPEVSDRDSHLRLGLSIEGDESAYNWVYPEIPQHVWIWGGDDEMILNRDPNAPTDIECKLDKPIP